MSVIYCKKRSFRVHIKIYHTRMCILKQTQQESQNMLNYPDNTIGIDHLTSSSYKKQSVKMHSHKTIIARATAPKFGDGHSLKHYAPELLAGVIFDIYDQHTQIMTELDVKLNKWHITIEKL